VASTLHLSYSGLPSQWISYPQVLGRKRPPVASVKDPPVMQARAQGVPLRASQLSRYASVCGFTEGRSVPCTFLHVLAMPLHLKIFATKTFPLRPMGLIHLSNVIEVLSEPRAGDLLDVEVKARNYRETDAGLAFDMDTLVTTRNEELWRETCVFLSRWPESPDRPAGRPPRPPKAPRDAAVLSQFEVTMRTVWDYARVSSDYNPIHLSDRAARYFGLRGAIAHGMWSLARSLAQPPMPAYGAGTRIDAQFLTPVQLPAKVAIKEWREEGQVKRALCDVRTGRVHMYACWAA
jgi:acyl dehydratase